MTPRQPVLDVETCTSSLLGAHRPTSHFLPCACQTPARGLADIPGLKQVGLLAGVAAAIAAAIWLVMWSQGQNYTVLYGQLSERESGQVMDALTAAGIDVASEANNHGVDFGPLGLDSRETKVEAMTRVFHDVVAAGRMPDHRELAKAAGADVSHARRIHRRLVAQQSG